MTLLSKPGIYHQTVRPSRRFGGLARADVCALMGYATRGPAQVPVRVESLRQFEAIFGAALEATHLYDAVKGFFECGGRTAYILRVVGAGAKAASVSLGGSGWSVSAHYPTARLLAAGPQDEAAVWYEELRRAYAASIPDPGVWGNAFALRVSRHTRLRTTAGSDEMDRTRLMPLSTAGFDVGAHVIVHRAPLGADPAGWFVARIDRVDAPASTLTLDREIAPEISLIDNPDVSVQLITFDFEVLGAGGLRAELFSDLHLDPSHPRNALKTLQTTSLYLAPEAPDAPDWTDPAQWPDEGVFALSGGGDDLHNLTPQDWRTALIAQKDIDEIALLAAPDLVLQGPPPSPDDADPVPFDDLCYLPSARPKGKIVGLVLDAETEAPIADCTVLAAGNNARIVTDAGGAFTLTGLTPGLVELRLSAQNYELAEEFVQTQTPQSATEPAVIRLVPLSDIKPLEYADILDLQRAMGTAGLAGPYRVAVLDPPAPDLSPEALLQWRQSLGQDPRLFAVAPWLEVEREGSARLRAQPASGHISGAFAQGEAQEGVHRAPANLPLRHVKQLSLDFDDPTLAMFHQNALNPVRALAGQGIRLMGSRSLAASYEWQQISVRRLFDAIEKTLEAQLSWSVFETNNVTTRQIMKFAVSQFLESLRKRGMFAGSSADEAYFVKCDGDNNTSTTIARGELLLEIGIAPTRPYEFLLFTLSAEAEAIEVTEQS